jgi:hypothetical protein
MRTYYRGCIKHCPGVWMRRLAKHLVPVRQFDYPAEVHDRHPVAYMPYDTKVMGNKQVRLSQFLLQFLYQVYYLGLD